MEHKVILLELSRREAWALAAIFQHIGGNSATTLRGDIDGVYAQLIAQSDIDPDDKWLDKAVTVSAGGLWFVTNDVPPLNTLK